MNYPLISEYIEAIKSAEDNFEELSYLRPVLGDDGLPVMTGGNFAQVFKMMDVRNGKFYAVKCFTKEQKGRAEAYREIAKELENVSSPYILSIRYLDKELFVDTDQTTETEFPVLLMDWVDGNALDKYLRQNLKRKKTLEKLLKNFFQLAKWLIIQPFAHGDLKPDNILVKNDGSLVLVDYDGMYVPAMKGQKSREIGSPDFCHPQRNEDVFDEHIDDFSILSILLSLCVFFIKPSYLNKYGAEDRLLFSQNDYVDIFKSNAFRSIPSIIESSTNYKSLFEKACKDLNFQLKIKSLMPINKLFTAITLQKEAKDNLKKEIKTRSIDDVEVTFVAIRDDINVVDPYIGNFRKKPTDPYSYIGNFKPTVPNQRDDTSSHKDFLKQQKREKATKWQAALLLQILTMLYPLLFFNNVHNSDGIWTAMKWGFGIGLIAWGFAYFDFIKRDGSFGNCLFAVILFPITFYFGIYSIICTFINLLKEWRKKHDNNRIKAKESQNDSETLSKCNPSRCNQHC